jgi:hypothetical protein
MGMTEPEEFDDIVNDPDLREFFDDDDDDDDEVEEVVRDSLDIIVDRIEALIKSHISDEQDRVNHAADPGGSGAWWVGSGPDKARIELKEALKKLL